MSGIGRQAKIPSEHQQQALLAWLETRKHSDRNRLIVLLSYKAGLRAKEIASLKWSMVMNANGDIGDHIHLTNEHRLEQRAQEALTVVTATTPTTAPSSACLCSL